MKVKVSTVAFSKNKYLVDELLQHFPLAEVNADGVRIPDDQLPGFFSGAEGIIVGLEKISDQLLDQLPDLRIIAKYGVGLDNIDAVACKERGIKIGWTGGVNKRSVAEMALGFILALCRNLYTTSNQLKTLVWNKSGGVQLSGKTIGIIGVGHIGKDLVSLLKPFGCNILVNDIIDIKDFVENHGLHSVSKDEIYRKADIISIHTPLTNETENLITKEVFACMKPTAYLINTARGGIVNEADLKHALQNGLIAGAALDVYRNEPPDDAGLLSCPELICTPHTGGNAYEAVVAMGLSAISHLVEYNTNKLS
jgi:D-3-phosphoglycerate dehydrogenase